jgi:hypothetical protein
MILDVVSPGAEHGAIPDAIPGMKTARIESIEAVLVDLPTLHAGAGAMR